MKSRALDAVIVFDAPHAIEVDGWVAVSMGIRIDIRPIRIRKPEAWLEIVVERSGESCTLRCELSVHDGQIQPRVEWFSTDMARHASGWYSIYKPSPTRRAELDALPRTYLQHYGAPRIIEAVAAGFALEDFLGLVFMHPSFPTLLQMASRELALRQC